MANKYRHQLTLSSLLRHAFMSGAGYGDLDKISEKDLARWASWDAPNTERISQMTAALEVKAPQDMNLRELFDHVTIVNDAIRAALSTHQGMTPPKSEGV